MSSSSQPEPEPPERDDSRESLSIDEQVSPSLAASAVSYQQTQIYSDFVMCCFPCIFKCTESRVPVTCIEFVDFISRRTSPSNTPFDWALRATTTTFTGFLYNDSRLIDAGASSYARALRSLAIALSDTSTAKSDEVLATAMGLAFYEKYTSPSPEPWLRHAAGIRTLMRMRGPDSHLHGFGHAMYVAYRHFFITAALIAGEECFLQEPEWQALNEKIVDQDAKQPHSSVYTDIVERGFREMVKTPGYVKQVRETLALPSKKQTAARSRLLQNIQASRAALRGVHTELGVSISMIQADHRDGGFIGPVPYFFFDGFSTHAMRGIRSGIVLLNHLVSLLDPKQRPAIDQENRTLADRASNSPQYASASLPTPPLSSDAPPGRPRLMIEAADTLGKKESITTDWMDRIVTTMGMDGVRVTLADSE